VFSFPDWSTGQDDKYLQRLERNRASARRYRETHKNQIKVAARLYRETHKDQINERARLKWRTDPELREKRRLWQRKNVFQKVYGISMADYEAMFERQGGACAICKRTGVTLCVDHCHLTGEVRGLLCSQCNSAIGFCSDDPTVLLAAAAYLQAARDRQQTQNSGCAVAGATCGEVDAGSPERTCATPESMPRVPIPQERDTR
jgi:Autographiviridae endonuclease VII